MVNCWEPVSRICPFFRVRSARSLTAERSPGAYWISSRIRGGGYCSKKRSGSSRASLSALLVHLPPERLDAIVEGLGHLRRALQEKGT